MSAIVAPKWGFSEKRRHWPSEIPLLQKRRFYALTGDHKRGHAAITSAAVACLT
jgi:hypothetical protein